MPEQLNFGGGINLVAAEHLIPEDQVASASNIDFTLEPGAAAVRRGSQRFWGGNWTGQGADPNNAEPISKIACIYTNNIGKSRYYVFTDTRVSSTNSGRMFLGTATVGAADFNMSL
jgi:hypothetical protein